MKFLLSDIFCNLRCISLVVPLKMQLLILKSTVKWIYQEICLLISSNLIIIVLNSIFFDEI